jgi:GAF domain-containing protein
MAAETEAEFPIGKSIQQRFGYRTVLATPLLREGLPIGVIAIRRAAMQPFSDKQIALIQTFADQAVIAIENVRLFAELQARNRELSDTLEQQTATSEILQVISSSPTNPPSRPRSDRQKRGPGLQRPECHRLVDRGRCP